MSTILIIGGAGFIGTNMAIEAIKRGHHIVAFDNLSRNEVKNNLTYMEKNYKDKYRFVWGDVRKMDDFEKLPQVDAVINMAANPSVVKSIAFPRYDFETNTLGTLNSLEFTRKLHIPYIYASTNKIYSDITNLINIQEEEKRYRWNNPPYENYLWSGVDLDENEVVSAINDKFPVDGFGKYGHSLYGVSKLAGELLVQEYGIQFDIPTVIFRMSCIYGLFQKGVEEQAWASWFIRQIVRGNGKVNIFGTGKQVRDMLWGGDTAKAYLDALESLSTIDKMDGQVYTLGGGPKFTMSLLEAIETIEELSGKKAKLSFHPKRPHDQDIYISSIVKVKEQLKWEPKITPREGLKMMIEEEMKS